MRLCCIEKPPSQGDSRLEGDFAELKLETRGGNFEVLNLSNAPAECFATPEPVSRSGGTADFFKVNFIGPRGHPLDRGQDFWIGKDLAHAADEIEFYEKIVHLSGAEFDLLRKWSMPYGGVLTKHCALEPGGQSLEDEQRQLLLLGNLRAGSRKLRMLDIKVGEATAVAGWKGKSRSAATRNSMVDKFTNSVVQGFRLEGFDSPPQSVQSQVAVPQSWKKMLKRSQRFQLQRLQAQEFLRYWIDFSDLEGESNLQHQMCAVEYSEALLWDAVEQTAALCVDALRMPVPQMWIGSSLALSCEGGQFQPRQSQGKLAKVKIFDWGRSELSLQADWQTYSQDDREQRQLHWDMWLRGMLRIFFEATSVYLQQFASGWAYPGGTLLIQVWDYDVENENDFIGYAALPLEPTNGPVTLELTSASERALSSTVEVEVTRLPMNGLSRLSQAWQIHVHGANALPCMDFFSSTDPFVVARLISPDEEDMCNQYLSGPCGITQVEWNDSSADFDCVLQLGDARTEVVDSLLTSISRGFETRITAEQFDQTGCEEDAVESFLKFLQDVPRLNKQGLADARRV